MFKSTRWSPSKELSHSNFQNLTDNDDQLLTDLSSYSLGFQLIEQTDNVNLEFELTSSHNFPGPTTVPAFYAILPWTFDLIIPVGTHAIMMGCNTTTQYNDATVNDGVAGIIFGDNTNGIFSTVYAYFVTAPLTGGGGYLSGRQIYTFTTTIAGTISISTYAFSTASGSVTLGSPGGLPRQFWVACLGSV